MKFNLSIILCFFLFWNSLQGQPSSTFWISLHSGYQFTENEILNNWIDQYWNEYIPGNDLEKFKGNISYSINFGASFIPKLPNLGFQIGFNYWNQEKSGDKFIPEFGSIPRDDFTLHLDEKHLITSLGAYYIFALNQKLQLKPGANFLLDFGELSVFSQGVSENWIADEKSESVFWKGNSSGTSLFLETNYSISASLEISLTLRQFIFGDKYLDPSNEDSILTIENHQSGFNNSGFGGLFGVRYFFIK